LGRTRNLRAIHIALVIVVLTVAVFAATGYWVKNFNVLLGVSGPNATTFTISVDSNTQWSGTVGGFSRVGSGVASFTVHTASASACLQMQTDSGYLTITIFENGKSLDSQTTSEPFGIVTVSAS
jgi:hypothetical protein